MVGQSERALDRLRSALRPALPGAKGAPPADLEALDKQMEATQAGFIESMDDDFNTAGALAQLFELVRAINQARADGATDDQLTACPGLPARADRRAGPEAGRGSSKKRRPPTRSSIC